MHIFLNPKNLIIPEHIKVIGYIIAEDKKVADDIQNFRVDDFEEAEQEIKDSEMAFKSLTHLKTNVLLKKNNKLFQTKEQLDNDGVKSQNKNSEIDNDIEHDQEEDGSLSESLEEEEDEGGVSVGMKQQSFKNMGNQQFTIYIYNISKKKYLFLISYILSGEWSRIGQNCYITKDKVILKDITFKNLEKNILATDHIILCGLVHNLINFIMPLRARYLVKFPTLVILNTKEPTEKQWNQISFFPEIYFVKGSALKAKDLKRANLDQASKVVILTDIIDDIRDKNARNDQEKEETQEEGGENTSSGQQELTKDEEDLLDARTIFKYKTIRKLRPDIQIVTELVNPTNFAFLLSSSQDYTLMKRHGYVHTPLFASGEVYLSSIMDSLCCQAYYYPALITVLNLLLLGTAGQSQIVKKNKKQRKNDNMDGFDYSEIENSNLYHIQVPKAYIGQQFTHLFEFLAKDKQIVTLGLYRQAKCKDNKLPYVYTNPLPETILTIQDLLLVLSSEGLNKEEVGEWGGPLEKRKKDALNIDRIPKNYSNKNDSRQNSETTNIQSDDILFNYEEIDKDNFKVRQNVNQIEQLHSRISEIMNKMHGKAKYLIFIGLKEDTQELHQILKTREGILIESVQRSFQEELQSQIKKKSLLNTSPNQVMQHQQSQDVEEDLSDNTLNNLEENQEIDQ